MYSHVYTYTPSDEKSWQTMISQILDIIKNESPLFLVYGVVGVGKSHFIRKCICSKITNIRVPSPSFLGYRIYQQNDLSIIHFDLYKSKLFDRLSCNISASEFIPSEVNTEKYATMVEWPPEVDRILSLKEYFTAIYTINITLQANNIETRKYRICQHA